MNMQCIRCLSSLFPKLGAKGCTFCAGQDARREVLSSSVKFDVPLPTNLVIMRPKSDREDVPEGKS